MSNTIFKRLFEVQILHDYYLTTADGMSFFQRNQAEKKAVLTKKITNNLYHINKLFSIQPLEATKVQMREYKLVMSKTALGFIVGIGVEVENLAGAIVYKPGIAFGDKLSLTFSISSREPLFKSMTNVSLRPPLPTNFYFTNKDALELNEGTVPNHTSLPLSKKPMVHKNGIIHEMGAIIAFGGNVREALRKTDGSISAHWETISDKLYVSNADRLLLPHTFVYAIDTADGVTQLQAVLENSAAAVIKTINRTSIVAMGDVRLNFSRINENDPNSADIPVGTYTLKIKANSGPEISYPVYLNDSIYESSTLGVVDIRSDEPNSPSSLLDASGYLKTRITAANIKVPHPVFEIRFKNRRTYWRYQREEAFSAAEITATAAHLGQQADKLISKKPNALTAALVPFVNGVSLMLPHPRMPSIKVEKDKIFSEIFINQSNRLLNS